MFLGWNKWKAGKEETEVWCCWFSKGKEELHKQQYSGGKEAASSRAVQAYHVAQFVEHSTGQLWHECDDGVGNSVIW